MNLHDKPDSTPMPEPQAVDPREDGEGRLVLRHADEKGEVRDVPVQAVCCFPWSRRRAFVSLRDAKGRELRLIEDLETVPPGVRRLIESHLDRRLFIPALTAVESITARNELFLWKVKTDAGPRSFLTSRTEHPRSMGDGRVLIKDVGNDLYLIEEPALLDAHSQRLLWIYLD
jgi:hypothetical protein